MIASDGLGGAEPLTSRRNPLVKQLRLLQESRGRREQGLLLLEGTHLLQESLRLGLQPRDVLATAAWLADHGELVAALPKGCSWRLVSGEVLEAIATTQHPDGVVASLLPPSAAAPGKASLVLALD